MKVKELKEFLNLYKNDDEVAMNGATFKGGNVDMNCDE